MIKNHDSYQDANCENCKYFEEDGRCEKIMMDSDIEIFNNCDEFIDWPKFIVPKNFGCNLFERIMRSDEI